ncbi:hypothetical protein [Streptococcus thoraltensis]|uniref:hypothetical protein n=1 Tax=Streptococcus thoraltensis TaxID=55085 RepID=UPI001F56A35D|nr:hypothetical protein [Streptococcus thoraltensis]
MTRTEWLEYFEAINGRAATEAELAQALAAGEFEDDQVSSSSNHQEIIYDVAEDDKTAQPHHQELPKQSVPLKPDTSADVKTNDRFDKVKAHSEHYLSWLLNALRRPQVDGDNQQLVFGGMTLILAAGFLAGALLNYCRRLLMSIANMSTVAGSLKTNFPEAYDHFLNLISREFGFGKFLYFFVLILIIYLVAYGLPAVLHKDSRNWMKGFGVLLGTTPLLLVLNVVAFLSTFLVKNALIVSEKYVSSITNIITDSNGQASDVLSNLLTLVKQIPALQSMVSVMTYLLVLSVVGLVVLLVSMVKAIKGQLSFLNNTYLSIVAVGLLLAVVYFIDKWMMASILDSFVSLKDQVAF